MGHVYSPLQEAGKVATKSARNRAGMRIYMHVCACMCMCARASIPILICIYDCIPVHIWREDASNRLADCDGSYTYGRPKLRF